MAAIISAEEYLARVERLSKELAQQGAERLKPKAASPAKATGAKARRRPIHRSS